MQKHVVALPGPVGDLVGSCNIDADWGGRFYVFPRVVSMGAFGMFDLQLCNISADGLICRERFERRCRGPWRTVVCFSVCLVILSAVF